MKKLEKRPSDTNKISFRLTERLNLIQNSLTNTEIVEGTKEHPPYLVVPGKIKYEEQNFEIRTSISIKPGIQKDDDDIVFSTNIGQLPTSDLSHAIVDRLNHGLSGKFVTLGAESENHVDVVYTTRQPADWLNQERFRRELENHAVAQTLVSPILDKISSSKRLASPQPESEENRNMAQNIIDVSLLSQQNSVIELNLPESKRLPQTTKRSNKKL